MTVHRRLLELIEAASVTIATASLALIILFIVLRLITLVSALILSIAVLFGVISAYEAYVRLFIMDLFDREEGKA